MDDIPWSKRSLAVLIEEGMLDELTAGIAEDWVKKYSLQNRRSCGTFQTVPYRNIVTKSG